jgi:hypothetical protein
MRAMYPPLQKWQEEMLAEVSRVYLGGRPTDIIRTEPPRYLRARRKDGEEAMREDKLILRCEIKVDEHVLLLDPKNAHGYRQALLNDMSRRVAELLVQDRPDLFREENPSLIGKTLIFSAAILSEAEHAQLRKRISELEGKVREMSLEFHERQGAVLFEELLAKRKAAAK